MNSYDNILDMLDEKYREVYTSLFTFNDDILDDNLLHYLYEDNYIVLMEVDGEVNVLSAFHSSLHAFDLYGNVKQGIARPQHMISDLRNWKFNLTNSVVVYSNKKRISMRMKITELLTELATVHYIMQNNLRLSNIKAVISASGTTASTMEGILTRMLLDNTSYIIAKDKENVTNQIDKVDLDVDYIAKEYIETIQFYHHQILEAFGINFTPFEKQERMVVGEVQANNEMLMSLKDRAKRMFDRYLKKANKLWTKSFSIEVVKQEVETQEPTETEPTNPKEEEPK